MDPPAVTESAVPLSEMKPKAAPYVYTYLDVCRSAATGNVILLQRALFGDGFDLSRRDKVRERRLLFVVGCDCIHLARRAGSRLCCTRRDIASTPR